MSSLPCLDNVIGLANTSCNCWDASKPVDFNSLNASSSGLYVAEPSGIPLRWTNSAADCENGGVWNLLIAARDKAVRGFLSDYLTLTQQTKQEQFDPFTKIGDDYYSGFVTVQDTIATTWIQPYRIKGAKLQIASVDIAFWSGISGSTSVDIAIYSSLDLTTPIDTATATVLGNKAYYTATFTSPVIIDLGEVRDDLDQKFYFVYTIPVGAVPVNNNTYIAPCCSNTKEQRNPYLQILCNGGLQASSVGSLETSNYGNNQMNGMVINASMECDYYSWLCELSQKPNEVYNTLNGKRLRLGMGLADGLQAGAIMHLANSILKSGRINSYTLILDDKPLYATREAARKEYEKAIKNMVYYMPSDVSDCLICQPSKLIQKGQILK